MTWSQLGQLRGRKMSSSTFGNACRARYVWMQKFTIRGITLYEHSMAMRGFHADARNTQLYRRKKHNQLSVSLESKRPLYRISRTWAPEWPSRRSPGPDPCVTCRGHGLSCWRGSMLREGQRESLGPVRWSVGLLLWKYRWR